MPLIIDSHLDLAWNALTWKRDLCLPLEEMNRRDAAFDDFVSRGQATTTFPEMKRGQIAVCLATLMGRVPYGEPTTVHGSSLDFPTHEGAHGFAKGQLAYYEALQEQGVVELLGNAESLQQHWQRCQAATSLDELPLGIIIAMEGCDAICEPTQAAAWFAAGLRCASLVHYGSSRYASGTGHDGPVTEDGKRLLQEFSRLGMILDTTHLCDQSFADALANFDGPVLASHQNCRALVPGQRQFSDVQIRQLIERGGILGVAFDAWMMSPGWIRGETTRDVVHLEAILDHVDHICQLAGDDRHVAIGSDLDGGFGTEQCPTNLDSIADLQKLAPALAARGYSDEAIKRIFGENWHAFFVQHLP